MALIYICLEKFVYRDKALKLFLRFRFITLVEFLFVGTILAV